MHPKSISTTQLIDYFEQVADVYPEAVDIADDLRLYKEEYESGMIATTTLNRLWRNLTDRISQFDLDLLLLEAGGFDEEELVGDCSYAIPRRVDLSEKSC